MPPSRRGFERRASHAQSDHVIHPAERRRRGRVCCRIGLCSTPAPAAEKLKVAAIFSTPIEEPWVNQIHVALQKAEKELGIEYKWSEKVQSADFGASCANTPLAATSSSLGDAFAAERESRRTRQGIPRRRVRVRFGRRAGRAQFRRLRQLDPRAGLSLRPDCRKDDQVERHRRGRGDGHSRGRSTGQRLLFRRQGGQSRRSRRRSTFIGSFFDPPKAKEAALAQIAAGVDVIYAERFGVIEAAGRKILAISNMSDQSTSAPTRSSPARSGTCTRPSSGDQAGQAGVFTAQDSALLAMAKGGAISPRCTTGTKAARRGQGAVERRRTNHRRQFPRRRR